MAEKPKQKTQPSKSSARDQKEGWITDQDMWDVTMDMIEDATIDYSLLDGVNEHKLDTSIPTINGGVKAPEKPRPATPQSRASTVRKNARLLQQRRHNPPITRQETRKESRSDSATTNRPSITAQKSSAKRDDSSIPVNKPNNSSTRNAIDKSQIVDYQLDRSKVTQQKTSIQKSVVKATQPVRMAVDKKSVAAAHPQKTPIPVAKPTKSSNNPAIRQRESINTVRQENYATFLVHEMSGAGDTQDVTAVMRKVKRERSVRRIFAIFPGILRLWLPITTAVLGFSLGYYVAESKYEPNKADDLKLESIAKNKVKSIPSVDSPLKKRTHEKPAVLQKPRQVSEVDGIAQTTESTVETDYQSNTQVAQADNHIVSPTDDDPNRTATVVESVSGFDQPQTALDITEVVVATGTELLTEITMVNIAKSDEKIENERISAITINDKVAPTPLTKNDLPALIDENLRKFVAKDWEAVISLSDKILSIEPREKSALTNRSVAYTELGAYALAIDDVNIVIEIEPDNALAINNRGYAYEKMGNIERSIEDYDFACKLGVNVSCTEAVRLRQTLSR